PFCHRFTVTLRDLEPDTTYVYSVGDGAEDHWTELAEFKTAPASTKPFSFIYMGDAQNGLDRWGSLVHTAFRERPDAAFYIMAGDLVNRGGDRDDWDSLFENAKDIYDRRPLVPAIGNHEDQDPTLYLREFDLPKNGPEKVEKERAYWFEYSNALFVILDTNISAESQASWLKDVLNQSSATWKFVVYHHPAYSSAPSRDNPSIREHWLPLFDEHHVDMALQGHDHAYLRTYPMKDGKRVDTTNEGTVYIVSVSGVKMYDQDPRDYTEFGMTNTATYQVLDIQISGDRLVYRAYDTDGNLKDELVIEK
ncbi:MAG TPA: phosphohydrolase, partial [Verrucomicrobiales bacterium]|nr:phosphohydrolase [Verrucomicrobiales bacterium]